MLKLIIGAWFYEYLSTPGISIEVQAAHFRSTHLQLLNWHSSLVGVKIIESVSFSQRG